MSLPMIGHAFILLAAIFTHQSGNNHAEDRQFLTNGVSALVAPGCLPGPLNAYDDAFVVIAANQGKGRVPLFVATKVDRGRAVAGGHEGFFTTKALENPSN